MAHSGEFVELLAGAECSASNVPERDRLVLMALVLTGMSRSELLAVRWADVSLTGQRPSLLVCRGKGGTRRRQPLPSQLSAELRGWHALRHPSPEQHVVSGVAGGPMRAKAIESIIARAAGGVLEVQVTAEVLRYTGAEWLRQAGARPWLIAEYLGQAASPISRYADIASEDMRVAVQSLADYAMHNRPFVIERDRSWPSTA